MRTDGRERGSRLARLVATAAACLALALGGCADDGDGTGGTGGGDTNGGGGGDTGGGGGGTSGAITSAAPATTGGDFLAPFDAAPDPQGETLYFVALMTETEEGGGAGVFRVPAAGGAAEPVFTGAPFSTPIGLAMAPAGDRLYVADPGAATDADDGALFRLALDGSAPTVVAGSEGTSPRSIDVTLADGVETVWFTGVDPADGAPAVFRVDGGTAAVAAKDEAFNDLGGVAVAMDGTIYVADTSGAEDGRGSVLRLADGAVTPVLAGVKLGYPAGIALSLDESALLVSAIDAETRGDMVIRVALADGSTTTFDEGIAQNIEGGGVHRAPDRDVYAWSDPLAGGGGTVYFIVGDGSVRENPR